MTQQVTTHTIETAYWHGDIVYLRVSKERKAGMVTRLSMTANGSVTYGVTWDGGADAWHFACELTGEYIPDFGSE